MSRPAEAYERIVERALRLVPEDFTYITALADAWRADLVDIPETDYSLRLEKMAASSRDSDTDAIVSWLDAFPDGIVHYHRLKQQEVRSEPIA